MCVPVTDSACYYKGKHLEVSEEVAKVMCVPIIDSACYSKNRYFEVRAGNSLWFIDFVAGHFGLIDFNCILLGVDGWNIGKKKVRLYGPAWGYLFCIVYVVNSTTLSHLRYI